MERNKFDISDEQCIDERLQNGKRFINLNMNQTEKRPKLENESEIFTNHGENKNTNYKKEYELCRKDNEHLLETLETQQKLSNKMRLVNSKTELEKARYKEQYELGRDKNDQLQLSLQTKQMLYDQMRQKYEASVLEKADYKAASERQKEEALRSSGLLQTLGWVREAAECPVCRQLPRAGPVPCCPNGHLLCGSCLATLAAQAGGRPAAVRCPSCKVPQGSARSLLAARLLEVLEHECRFDGCEEVVAHAALEAHEARCRARRVLCPGDGVDCDQLVPFCDIRQHALACPDIKTKIWHNAEKGKLFSVSKLKLGNEVNTSWITRIIEFDSRVFFFRMAKLSGCYQLELVLAGSELECESYLAELAVLDCSGRPAVRTASPPRALSTERWGDLRLTVPERALARVWRPDPLRATFGFRVQVRIVRRDKME
jgi:hypothetical protein